MISMTGRLENIVFAIALMALIVIAFLYYYDLASTLTREEISRNGKGYVSDEVWYVSSARNILIKIFHLSPKMKGNLTASIVYANNLDRMFLEECAISSGVRIVDDNYRKIHAVFIEFKDKTQLDNFTACIERKTVVTDIIYGWRIPDAENINNYLNLEHPPLVKYIIALSMYLLGDYPTYWRIPGIIVGLLIIVFVFLVVAKLTSNKALAMIVSILVAFDPLTRTMSSIAMLDIYVALFTLIAAYFIVARKYNLAIVMTTLGSIVKFSVLFLLLPLMILYVRNELKKDPTPINMLVSLSRYILVSVMLFLGFQLIVSIPIIMYIGISSWFEQSLIGAILWHASTKCVGATCPVSSAPWDWFIGANAFVLYYFTNGETLRAMGFWPLWTISLSLSLIFLPAYRRDRRFGYSSLILLGLIASYVFLWIIGGRTQYSFYSAQFIPFVYMTLIISVAYIILDNEKLGKVFMDWKKLFEWLWNRLLDLLLVKTRSEPNERE